MDINKTNVVLESLRKYYPESNKRYTSKQEDAFIPFVKKTLSSTLHKVQSNRMHSEHAMAFGEAVMESLIDRSDLNIVQSPNDNTYTSLIKWAINKEGRQYNTIKSKLESVGIPSQEADILTDDQLDAFIDRMGRMTPSGVNRYIEDRVADATKKFIDDRNDKRETIKVIYQQAKSKAQNAEEPEDQAAIETAYKAYNTKMNMKPISLMEALVMSLAEYAVKYKNDAYEGYYNESGNLNMGAIVEDAEAIYAALEVANVSGLITIDSKLINDLLASFK